jgi:serine/threonine-protein kinase
VNRLGVIDSLDSSWSGRLVNPRLSGGGSQLAVSQFSPAPNIWVKDLKSGSLTRRTFGSVLDYRPRWAFSDASITFVAPRPPIQLGWDVYSVGADGAADSLILDVEGDVREAFWSPDGEWLVVQERLGDQDDLYAVRREAMDELVTLSAGVLFSEGSPELSPDGRCLVYQSDESGRTEVLVRPFPNTNAGRTQVSLNGGEEPVWARSGRELFYVSASQNLMVADVTTHPTCRVRGRRRLFSIADYRWRSGYDVRWDDQGFVFVRGQEEAPGDVVLVQNFFEELKAKVP